MPLHVIEQLPDDALEAAAEFYARDLEVLMLELAGPSTPGEDLLIVFPPASHEHRAWRLAAIQDLARRAAPVRVNGVVREDGADLAAASRFLAGAPGITGQLLAIAAD